MDVSKEGTDGGAQTTSPLTHPPPHPTLTDFLSAFPTFSIVSFQGSFTCSALSPGVGQGGKESEFLSFLNFCELRSGKTSSPPSQFFLEERERKKVQRKEREIAT